MISITNKHLHVVLATLHDVRSLQTQISISRCKFGQHDQDQNKVHAEGKRTLLQCAADRAQKLPSAFFWSTKSCTIVFKTFMTVCTACCAGIPL